jgi:DNA polymerase-3 subunit chi
LAEIGFYQLEHRPLEAVLPRLIEKAHEAGHRIVIRAPEAMLARLDEVLWTYDEGSFLPHGRTDAEQQPILLSTGDAPVNGATALVMLAPPFDAWPEGYERIMVMFEKADAEALAAARSAWKGLSGSSHARSYWQQTERGGFTKAA